MDMARGEATGNRPVEGIRQGQRMARLAVDRKVARKAHRLCVLCHVRDLGPLEAGCSGKSWQAQSVPAPAQAGRGTRSQPVRPVLIAAGAAAAKPRFFAGDCSRSPTGRRARRGESPRAEGFQAALPLIGIRKRQQP